ncbi:hypothetical protein CWI83_03045 [Pseudidiomarina taiwanensis]|uniref:DUF3549 domain-containing protein n=2 Tax=Pseudidiomarina taiwanensis TaxID=337250 RepID=A0A432ZNN9_9GAMM|nr:hypothetical protein CWI83_03045 [Pseudidiomarina taiwanensis]
MDHDASPMTVSNLAELLQASQSDYRVYEMGRRVQTIAREQFEAISAQQQAYPCPTQAKARFAIEFWPQLVQVQYPFIWFIEMPIDERGLLDLEAQQHFIQQVVALLGHQLGAELTEEQQQQLQQSPYIFTPDQQRLAALHARLTRLWQQPPSVYYEMAQSALCDGASAWQQLGLQGIHDVLARLIDEPKTAAAIVQNFSHYPPEFCQLLAQAASHQQLPKTMLAAFCAQQQLWQKPSAQRLAALELMSSATAEQFAECFEQVLQQPSGDELLLCAARLWHILTPQPTDNFSAEQLHRYLSQLAKHACANQDFNLSNAIVLDLLRLPDLKAFVLAFMRSSDHPEVMTIWQQLLLQLEEQRKGAN